MDRSGPDARHLGRDTELVVVAIPREDDYTWKLSSEKIPHMTLLYLGNPSWSPAEFNHAVGFIEHAASLLDRFGMSVDRRGTLGDKEADVLFFDKSFNYDKLNQFRGNLLADRSIHAAYHSASQFPQWTPHLTLGFPDTPAKEDEREYPGINWVQFDRVALWSSPYEGPTFVLKNDRYELAEASMTSAERGEAFLEHYGVKGMKWGDRKKSGGASAGPEATTVVNKGRRIVVSGGRRHPASDDATKTAVTNRVARKSGVKALTNKELQEAVNRMNLEKQFKTLTPNKGPVAKGQKAVKTLLGAGRTANEVVAFNNSPAGIALREKIKSS